MTAWFYKWLPILFGCHCRPDRSFFFRGRQLPVCARCTGELIGMALLFPTWVIGHPNAICSLVLLFPLVADGMLQLCTRYESGNFRRLVTGILFGYALANLLLLSSVAAFRRGFEAGLAWRGV